MESVNRGHTAAAMAQGAQGQAAVAADQLVVRRPAGLPPLVSACAFVAEGVTHLQPVLHSARSAGPETSAPAAAAATPGSSNVCNQCHLYSGPRAPGQRARVPAPCGGGGALGPRGERPLGRGTRIRADASCGLWVGLQGRSVSRELLSKRGRPLQLHRGLQSSGQRLPSSANLRNSVNKTRR